jgi:hypothetical protein
MPGPDPVESRTQPGRTRAEPISDQS